MRTINVTKERREPGCNSNVSRRAHWHRAECHVLHLRTCIKRSVLSSSLIARRESTIQRRIPLFLSTSTYRAPISGSAPRNLAGREFSRGDVGRFEIIFYDYLSRNEKLFNISEDWKILDEKRRYVICSIIFSTVHRGNLIDLYRNWNQ